MPKRKLRRQFCDDAPRLSSSPWGLFVFAPHTFEGAERLCDFLLIHTQKLFAHARRVHNFTRAHISKRPWSVSCARHLRKFRPSHFSCILSRSGHAALSQLVATLSSVSHQEESASVRCFCRLDKYKPTWIWYCTFFFLQENL